MGLPDGYVTPQIQASMQWTNYMTRGAVQTSDWKPLETIAGKAIKEKQPFERLVVSKPNLLEMFKHNKYKQHIIGSKIPDGTSTTVYRCGPLIDLCVGPHVPNTGRIKTFEIMKVYSHLRVACLSLLISIDKSLELSIVLPRRRCK
jgi:threonyl-tRNA synthetase